MLGVVPEQVDGHAGHAVVGGRLGAHGRRLLPHRQTCPPHRLPGHTVTGDRSQTGLQQGTIHGRQTGHRHRGPVTDGAAAGDYTRPTDGTPSPGTSHRRGCSRGLYTADRRDTVTGDRSQTGLQQGTIHGRQTGHRHRGPVTDGAAAGDYTRPTDGTPSPGTSHRRGCSRGLYTADRRDTVTGNRSQTGLQQGTIHRRQTGHRHRGPVTDGAAAGDYTRPTDGTPSPGTTHRRDCSRGLYTADRRDTVTGNRSQTGLQQGTIHGRQTGHRHRGPVTDGAAAGDYTRPTDGTLTETLIASKPFPDHCAVLRSSFMAV